MTYTKYLQASSDWQTAHSGALAAVLVMSGVANPPDDPALDVAREQLEADLRARFGEMDRPTLRATSPIDAYDRYYRRFGQTYHVQHQVESVAIKSKPIPQRAALVEAMFMAELETQILTAGHDFDTLELPVTVDIARAGDAVDLFSGANREPPVGDMLMRDGVGIISSVTLGPDARTQILPATTNALFAVYAPVGVDEDQVRAHFSAIERNVRLVAPDAATVATVLITVLS